MVTLKTIADECGLSSAAVSKALRHLPGVSEEKARQVREVAQRLGYVPNVAARTLRTSRSYNVGVLYEAGMDHEFFSSMLSEVRARLEREGYDVTLLSNEYKHEDGYYGQVMRRQCDGVIIMHHIFDSEGLDKLLSSTVPVVSIDRVYTGCTSILSENDQAMHEIVDYLVGMGHRRIAFVHGEMGDVTRARIDGFRTAMAAHGIEVPDDYLVQSKYQNPEAARIATREVLLRGPRPTCVLFPDDFAYLGALAEMQSQGLSVPDDISCFGFDGIRLASAVYPSLATYKQNSRGMGRMAVEALLEQIEAGHGSQDGVIRVTGSVQPGGTVRKIG
ncbi:MAG: LacI family transcriptional regulator [Atopobiaceae bacterium]|jgi:LacI family transcriptional regulator|nr:LacI family transcriptional regulator [Atopobiaceae bacterium]